jgi:hypothetical protein
VGYFGTMLKRHLAMGLLIFALLSWALVASFHALTTKSETILIGIDQNGTRIISKADDPLFKTEVVNFLRRFVALQYNFDESTFEDNVGSASELMTIQLWEREKAKIIELGKVVKKEKIAYTANLQKITTKDGKFQMLLETNQMMRMKNAKSLIKVDVEIVQTKRTAQNPWGMEIASLTESKAE